MSAVLKQRIVTAALLLTLVMSTLYLLPALYFALLLAAFLAVGAWEWARLMAWSDAQRVAGIAVVLGVLVVLAGQSRQQPFLLAGVLVIAALGWAFVLAVLLRAPRYRPLRSHGMVATLPGGIFLLVPPGLALMHIQTSPNHGPAYVLFLMLLVAVADTSAYFTGRKFGKRKLAPQISPGKTVEGALGGLLATALYALAGGIYFGLGARALAGFIVLCAITVVFSIVGDLFESLMKRQAEVKDSGTLLPGHGGVLDRIDSMTAAAPIFALGLLLLERFV